MNKVFYPVHEKGVLWCVVVCGVGVGCGGKIVCIDVV